MIYTQEQERLHNILPKSKIRNQRIESVQEAIDAAKEHAKLNGLDILEFYCGDTERRFTEEFLANHPKPNVLVTDPPRDGNAPKWVEQILKLAPPKIVYVSCNSATPS